MVSEYNYTKYNIYKKLFNIFQTVETPKYIQIAELIKRRIANGDYHFMPLPGAPKLSQELGVSYLTVRQAVQLLLEEKILIRKDSDRLEIAMPEGAPRLRVALLHPGHVTCGNKWFDAIRSGTFRHQCSFRDIVETNPDDPLLYDALDGDFDIIFCYVPQNRPLFVNKLKKHRERIVTLFTNLTEYGIRCLDGISNQAVEYAIRHLYECGCGKIDFFLSSLSSGSLERKQIWNETIRKLGCTGKDWSVEVPETRSTREFVLEKTRELIAEGAFRDTEAVFCSTMDCAIGVMRALADYGIRVPENIMIASMGNPEIARLCTPSVTVIDTPDLTPLIDAIFAHYLGWKSDPEHLYFRFELEQLSPEKIIIPGESTFPKKQMENKNKLK